MATSAGEKRKTRSELVRGARMGPFALRTAIVGTLVGGVIFAVLVAAMQIAYQQDKSTIDLSKAWDTVGRRGGVVLGGILILSYLVATFVAGRMAWRRGWLHGLAAEIDIRDRIEAGTIERAKATRPAESSPEPAKSSDKAPADRTDRVDIDGLTKDELYEMAQERDLPGRSQMTKEELARALQRETRTSSSRR